MLRVAWYGVVVVAGDGVNNKYMEPIKLWIVQHQPSQETRVLAEFDGINWDLGSGIVENARVVRGNVHTRILQGWGWG